MKAPDMTSSKPYLIRALYEWITDNGMIPHLVVNVNVDNIKVPLAYAENGRIVLNISHTAAVNLQIDNDYITFSARFSGTPMNVVVPTFSVLAIYAKETGAGMVFDEEEDNDGGNPPPPPPSPPSKPSSPGKSHLKLVKS
jgi:stringent starvation protein B